MKILRDLRLSTEMLILFELVKNSRMKPKQFSEKLDMTVQGVSEYLNRMESDKLIQHLPDEYKPTRKGVQQLHHNVIELRDFVVEAVNRLEIIQTCIAIARTKINKDTKVGLFMENGILMAYANKPSTSTGTALFAVKPGDDVVIKDLVGIVELAQGRFVIVELPKKNEKNQNLFKNLNKLFSKTRFDRIGALDVSGLVAIRKMGLKCDFEFASANAGIEATQKGLNVILIGSTDEVVRIVTNIEEQNAKSAYKLKLEVIKTE